MVFDVALLAVFTELLAHFTDKVAHKSSLYYYMFCKYFYLQFLYLLQYSLLSIAQQKLQWYSAVFNAVVH